jgi:hypothetical protein
MRAAAACCSRCNSSARAPFFLGHADLLAQRSASASAACMRLVRSPIFFWLADLILRDLIELAVLVVNEKRRRAGIGNGQQDKNPFADIALRLGW